LHLHDSTHSDATVWNVSRSNDERVLPGKLSKLLASTLQMAIMIGLLPEERMKPLRRIAVLFAKGGIRRPRALSHPLHHKYPADDRF
jgi:hypothetical protein